jgi:hypothetical protein
MNPSAPASLLSPVIAAAVARAPRRRPAKDFLKKGQKSTNNFVAEGPSRGNRKGAGAPLGNRNAWQHGGRSKPFRVHRRRVRALIADTDALTAELRAMAKSASRHERKTARFRYYSA